MHNYSSMTTGSPQKAYSGAFIAAIFSSLIR